MYTATDKFLKILKEKIRQEFNRLQVLAFDELNVVGTKEETKTTFDRLLEFNEKEYLKIAKEARLYALSLLTAKEREKAEKEETDSKWWIAFLAAFLASYNSVTGYLYKREAERKRLRLAEEMLTAREFRDRNRYRTAIQKGANLWFTQSGQYAIDLEDYTVLYFWKKAGLKKVEWVAELDKKTCSKCRDLNGQIFNIDEVPPKQHYHCRCYLLPYREEE